MRYQKIWMEPLPFFAFLQGVTCLLGCCTSLAHRRTRLSPCWSAVRRRSCRSFISSGNWSTSRKSSTSLKRRGPSSSATWPSSFSSGPRSISWNWRRSRNWPDLICRHNYESMTSRGFLRVLETPSNGCFGSLSQLIFFRVSELSKHFHRSISWYRYENHVMIIG